MLSSLLFPLTFNRFDDFFGSISHSVCADDIQPRFGEHLFAEFNVGAFQADYERDLDAELSGPFDNSGGDDVALHDAAEDVDQNPFDLVIGEDELECFGDAFDGGAATYVEEVGRIATVVLDDVHGRHGQAGTVDHTADVAIQGDVREVVLRGLDLIGILFIVVAQVTDAQMTEQRIVVKVQLGIEAEQLAFAGQNQRVDFEQ